MAGKKALAFAKPAGITLACMAVKSKAQRRKFAELLVEGKITREVYERWNRKAGKKKLPERVRKSKKRKKSKSKKKTGR
jgi:hypothetical protein